MNKKKNTLLWKISGEKLPADSYLFGTMHVKDLRVFTYLPILYDKISKCESFAIEFNLEEMEHNLDGNAMLLPDNQTIGDILSPKIYQKLEKLFRKQTKLPLAQFEFHLPILISNLLTDQLMSSDMPFSLDETLWRYAREQGKITLGIETYQEQLDILQKIKLKDQLKSLIWMIKNFKSHRAKIKKMTAYYEAGDIQKLYKSSKKGAKGMRKILIYDRNEIMAERIAKIVPEQSLFCAIGAGHLAGQKGVIRLLKNKGFKVKPILLTYGEA